MPTISFSGLGSGIDFGRIVDQLVQVRRIPIDKLKAAQQTVRTKLTDYGTVGVKLVSLQTAASALKTASSFDKNTATVGDEAVLTASASSTATPGSYTVKVTQLAAAHSITNKAAKAVASTGTSVTAAGATFTFRVGSGSNQTVTLAAGATLDDLKNAINNLGAGVSATAVNTGTVASPAYRLVLTATTAGAGNAITIVTDTTDLDFLNASGTGGTDTLQAAQDAIIVLGDPAQNPVTLQRSSNTITDAIEGVTLNLKKTSGTSTVSVNVTRDLGAIKTNIKSLISAYNDIVGFISERTTYDIKTKKGGIFMGEQAARTVLSRVRTALADSVSGLSTYVAVGDVGFKTERDGKITLDEAKLDSALSSNYTAVRSLFINDTSTTGVAQRIYDAVDTLDDVETGTVTAKKNELTKQNTRLSDDIKRQENLLSLYEASLRRQYAALDGLLRQIQAQQSALSGLSSTTRR